VTAKRADLLRIYACPFEWVAGFPQVVTSRVVSTSTLRRYRAERLLRQEFGRLRDEVLSSVRGRLRARGVHLDGGDLEACYAQAWQGLYGAIAAGEEIANPGGWLTVVTFRRAIDEHRGARARGFGSLARVEPTGVEREMAGAAAGTHVEHTARSEPDFAAELDNRAKLRQLFEALRGRLSARECEAAALCYLQGLTRAQAAQGMGISEARMTKLMEGRGPGSPGVAGKVGELLEAISGGEWCEQQGSLMRGFAFGVLDPRGERYRLARLHQRECPACRAYVLSLRGLAAALPPLPPPWWLGLQALSTRTSPTHAGAGAKAGAGTGAGGIAASGAAGAGGAAGGGWLLGGSVGAKLAVGCVLALSVGCVALTVAPRHAGASHRRHTRPSASLADAPSAATDSPGLAVSSALGGPISGRASAKAVPQVPYVSPTARAAAARRAADRHAQREFGLERPTSADVTSSSTRSVPATARAASVRRVDTTGAAESTSESVAAPKSSPSRPPSRAEREFGPE
jgi:DNA-directed RNA polymerase specialized sigma24 family protein